ncbi:MAG: hypothetical protein K0Q73_6341 [Paenibacillus sp.]|jgi:hypothetical protein|nr:hypothetical protein [Paenibacillus sp.]
MKFCSKCKNVYQDGKDQCLCSPYSWDQGVLKTLPIEAVCRDCGSIEELIYKEPWNGVYGTYGNECQCAACKKKIEDRIQREEAMKYLVLDGYRDEDVFCDDKEAVEEHFKYYMDEPWEYENSMSDIIILKLELVTGDVKAEHFKPPHNTHLVFWDGETYRVEEVIEPNLENQGSDYSLNW